jgi:hypothetical protein
MSENLKIDLCQLRPSKIWFIYFEWLETVFFFKEEWKQLNLKADFTEKAKIVW